MDGYTIRLASDVDTRDGMGLELYDSSDQMVAEVFFDDRTGDVTVWSPRLLELPPRVVEWYLQEARRRLPPSAATDAHESPDGDL
jgi:hypothetical protein